ncbi:Aspartic protease [Psilocybe cubensis]|uniref:Peptidase A1 domain-containing protein n=2 Tax=Psilocybe cubensis TaxID=181762 RepID=A0A8H7Y2T6_PSICU|nr:Aspartic protease [Psilocybe cubensis]KAH9481352.1 Aspartic protease [Psilocybe cubensis]
MRLTFIHNESSSGSPNVALYTVMLLQLVTAGYAAVGNGMGGHIIPRAPSDLITLPIRTLHARSPADNTTFGASLTSLSLASNRQSYYTIITVGGLNFRVDLDTGSADLWLASSACETITCKNIPLYPLNHRSPSFVELNANETVFKASYADTTFASGFVARETIGLSNSNLTIANQVFGVVTDSNVSLTDQTTGIMGLGFPRLSSISTAANASSFFATLAARGVLEYPLFALSLTRNASGTLTFGAIDSSVVTNATNIGWNKVAQFPPFGAESNVSSYLQWAIPITGIAVNGTQFTPTSTYANIGLTRSLALFDIGSPGIYGPYQDVSRIFTMIDGARLVDASNGQWALPCDTTVPMSFTFGQRNYSISPTDYIIGPASGNPNLCLSWPLALPPSSDGIDWQFGSAFLRTVYSIFNFGINGKEPPLIGLYPLQNSTNITETQLASFLSANSATVTTTLPNFILSTPTFTTPPYTLNTSVSVSVGGIVSSGLANTTYSALFAQKTALTNVSALPTISPSPTVRTLVVTDSAGDVSTTVSIASMAAVTLGLPSSSAASIHITYSAN